MQFMSRLHGIAHAQCTAEKPSKASLFISACRRTHVGMVARGVLFKIRAPCSCCSQG